MSGFIAAGLVMLVVSFKARGNSQSSKHTVRAKLTDTVAKTKHHITASVGLSGRLSYKGVQLDQYAQDILRDHGVCEGSILELTSFTPPKRIQHTVKVKVLGAASSLKNSDPLSLKVNHTSTLEELKHKIQDAVGIPVEDQLLKYKDKEVKSNMRTVELYTANGGGNLSVELKPDAVEAQSASTAAAVSKQAEEKLEQRIHTVAMKMDSTTIVGIAEILNDWERDSNIEDHIMAVFRRDVHGGCHLVKRFSM